MGRGGRAETDRETLRCVKGAAVLRTSGRRGACDSGPCSVQGSSVSLIDSLTQACLECHDDSQEPLPPPRFLLLPGSDFDTGERDSRQ